MFIAGLGTAVPEQCYTQQECWEALQEAPQFPQLAPRSRAILRKVLTGNNGIRTRHLVLDPLAQAFELDPNTLHQRFARWAPALATSASRKALQNAGTRPDQIDAVLVSTCTGYLCPGLTSYLTETLGLRSNVFGLDLVGQGCAAAIPNLRTAEALLASGRAERVLSVCVEICSAAMYLDDDPGVLISACLFGDAAGAAVLTSEPAGGRSIQWKTSASLLKPEHRDTLRFEHRNGLLRNLLSPEVPAMAAEAVHEVLTGVLESRELSPDHIQGWAFHPGGRDVLNAIERKLELDSTDLRWSAHVLEHHGNLSSASLYFVLEQALRDHPQPGHWWISSFGAGFTCHGALVEVGENGTHP